MTNLDLAAIAKLGLVDDMDIDDANLEDDEGLLAELAGLQQPKKDPAMLRAEALRLKREALALKRAGQSIEAVKKLREAKALEQQAVADPKEVQRRELPAMEALAQVAVPDPDVQIHELVLSNPADDVDDPDLAAEMAALSGESSDGGKPAVQKAPIQKKTVVQPATDEVLELKKRAIALKRAGDLEGAIACLKQAKAMEAAPEKALDRVKEVRRVQTKKDIEKAWRGYREALDVAMKGAVADAKRRLADGDTDGARTTTSRARELKSMLEAAGRMDTSEEPPTYQLIEVKDRAPRIFRDVPEDKGAMTFSRLRFPCSSKDDGHHKLKVKLKWDFAGGQAQGESDLVDLVQQGSWLVCDATVDVSVGLDAGLVAARKLLKKPASPDNLPEKRRLEVAKRTAAKFARAKLQVDAYVAYGGLGGLFGRRETLAGKAKVALEPLLTKASLKDTAKLRADHDAPPVLSRGGQFDVQVRLREPLRDPDIVDVVARRDILILEETKAPAPPKPSQRQEEAPPEAECRDPHAPTLLLSDRVLDAEIAAAEKGNDLAATARRLALATASQLLVAEVNSGKLTPASYADRISKRKDADIVLARWLAANGRPHDAVRVKNRITLVNDELKELRDAGEI